MSIEQLPESIKNKIEASYQTVVVDFQFVSGGCINNGGKLTTLGGDYFMKWNTNLKFPGMFKTEAKGLNLLAQCEAVRVPEVVGTGEVDNFSFIVMEWLERSGQKAGYWENFGRQLARQHKTSAAKHGLDHNNYIGSLMQINSFEESWVEFFIHHRLLFQLKMAVDTGRIDLGDSNKMEKIIVMLNTIIPEEEPALLHGDMWSGNLITGPLGEPCLIDPAVYFGHREMDLAMSRLFGGFDDIYISAYQNEFPLEKKWEKRIDLWNLYPLLVHVNLFGGGYLGQVKQILKNFQ